MGKKNKKREDKTGKTMLMILVFIIILGGIGIYVYNRASITDNAKLKDSIFEDVEKHANTINENMLSTAGVAESLANTLAAMESYDVDAVSKFIESSLKKNDSIAGSGYWLEPYMHKTDEKYYGPYFFKDDSNAIIKTMDYSNGKYDYFEFDWYKNGLDTSKKLNFTPMYQDLVINTTFMTCTSPIVKDGKAIGVATVDMNMEEIEGYILGIKVGDSGYAYILTKEGLYWANEGRGKHDLEERIIDSTDNEVKELGNVIIKSEKAAVTTVNSTAEIVGYSPIGDTGLYLVLVHSMK